MSHGQVKREGRPLTDNTLHFNGASMQLQNSLRNRKAEPCSGITCLMLVPALIVPVKDMRKVIRCNSAAGIRNLYLNSLTLRGQDHRDATLWRRVLESVLNQIVKNPFDQSNIGPYQGRSSPILPEPSPA